MLPVRYISASESCCAEAGICTHGERMRWSADGLPSLTIWSKSAYRIQSLPGATIQQQLFSKDNGVPHGTESKHCACAPFIPRMPVRTIIRPNGSILHFEMFLFI